MPADTNDDPATADRYQSSDRARADRYATPEATVPDRYQTPDSAPADRYSTPDSTTPGGSAADAGGTAPADAPREGTFAETMEAAKRELEAGQMATALETAVGLVRRSAA